MKTNYVLTIKAEDRPGLLHLLTGVLNKKLIPIISLSAASTDISDIVLVTMEVEISEKALAPLLAKLKNIIEVFAADAVPYDQVLCVRAAYFKMARPFLESPQMQVLQKYSAVIVNTYPDGVLIAKYGTDAAIRTVYNELEGPYLIGFSQTGVIAESSLIGGDESSVISLAA
jgi:acetolactate synthase small subunit